VHIYIFTSTTWIPNFPMLFLVSLCAFMCKKTEMGEFPSFVWKAKSESPRFSLQLLISSATLLRDFRPSVFFPSIGSLINGLKYFAYGCQFAEKFANMCWFRARLHRALCYAA
jgi:hypothetical protein